MTDPIDDLFESDDAVVHVWDDESGPRLEGEKWHTVCRDCTSEALYNNAEDAEAHALSHEATFGHGTAVGRVA